MNVWHTGAEIIMATTFVPTIYFSHIQTHERISRLHVCSTNTISSDIKC